MTSNNTAFSATKHLSFGLNQRTITTTTKPKQTQNVFRAESSDDEGADVTRTTSVTGRKGVNQAILQEQEYIRERAKRAAAELQYNYDEYENRKEEKVEEKKKQEKGGSKYIQKLVQTAKVRKIENDIAYERKVAREQMKEEKIDEYRYRDKEKFVTKAYKKKLEEREEYRREQVELEKKEMANDVTKRGIGAMMTPGFYSNLNKTISGTIENTSSAEAKKRNEEKNENEASSSSVQGGDEISYQHDHAAQEQQINSDDTKSKEQEEERKRREAVLKRAATRAARAEKVAAARERYFIRHQIAIA